MIVYLDKYLNINLNFQICFLIAHNQVKKRDDRFLKMANGLPSPTYVNND